MSKLAFSSSFCLSSWVKSPFDWGIGESDDEDVYDSDEGDKVNVDEADEVGVVAPGAGKYAILLFKRLVLDANDADVR